MDGIATLTEFAADRHPNAGAAPFRTGHADRFRARGRSPGQSIGLRRRDVPPGPACQRRSSGAPAASETALVQLDRHEEAWPPLAPPSPDTVVAASLRHGTELVKQARAREAAHHAEHAAEVARLTGMLREAKAAHAAEIERLRDEHAAKLRRLVEAYWRTRDAAQTGTECPNGQAAKVPQAPRLWAHVRLPGALRWLARITGKG